jgi:hypothetical protein
MRPIVILIILISSCKLLSAQVNDTLPVVTIDKQHLLAKSKLQKTIGWTIVGTGAPVALVTGVLLVSFGKDVWDEGLATVVFVGSTAYTIAGISLIKAGSRNKQRALSLALIQNNIMVPAINGVSYKPQPAISINIPLN